MLQGKYADPMTTLQNRWYNCLVGELELKQTMFQISQPSPPIARSDCGLWAYLNVIPPESLTFNHNVCSVDFFFKEYAAAVSQIQFPESTFEEDIGKQNYQDWLAYLRQQRPPPTLDQLPRLFRRWAILNDPSVVPVGVSDLTEMVLISGVKKALLPYQGPGARHVDFIGAYTQLLQTVVDSSGRSFLFDSSAASEDVGSTWSGGKNICLDGLWTGSGITHMLSRRFAESKVTVNARFKAYAEWTSTPDAWYNSTLLNIIYSSQATPPWIENANPNWDDLFGPGGSMQRFIASLVVVDGMNAAITSDAIYSKSHQQTILNNASRGLWPFYAPNNNGTVTNLVTFDDASGMKIETFTQPGNLLVIGANVLGVAQYLGHATNYGITGEKKRTGKK